MLGSPLVIAAAASQGTGSDEHTWQLIVVVTQRPGIRGLYSRSEQRVFIVDLTIMWQAERHGTLVSPCASYYLNTHARREALGLSY